MAPVERQRGVRAARDSPRRSARPAHGPRARRAAQRRLAVHPARASRSSGSSPSRRCCTRLALVLRLGRPDRRQVRRSRELPRGVLRPAGPRRVPPLGRADRLLRGRPGHARAAADRRADAAPGARASRSSARRSSCRRRSPASWSRRRWSGSTPTSGPLNALLGRSGSARCRQRGWLGDFTWALPAVGVIGTWVTFGLCMVLFVAGVQKISTVALRRGARRRRRADPRVLRRHAAGAAQRDRRRVRADDDQRPAQLRHHLQRDERRARATRPTCRRSYMYQNAFVYNRVGYASRDRRDPGRARSSRSRSWST